MSLLIILRGILAEPLLTVALVLFFLCSLLFSLLYFRVQRPRRGTMEWMQRVDAPHFAAPKLYRLQWSDLAWLVLSVACASLLRFFYLFIYLHLHTRSNTLAILMEASGFFLTRLVMGGFLAGGIYLLVRLLFHRTMPALCAAALSGLLLNENLDSTLFLCLSLLFLYLWMASNHEAPLALTGLWFVLSGGFYAIALLSCWPAAWLAPFYVAVYVVTQFLRYRSRDPLQRNKKLLISLLLTALCLIAGVGLLWLVYCLSSNRWGGTSPLALLSSPEFYRSFFPVARHQISELFVRPSSYFAGLFFEDSFLFLAGSLSLIPLLHGVFLLKDSRCLWLLGLLPCVGVLWLLCGIYLLPLPLLLILSYQWSVNSEKGKHVLTLLSAASMAVFYSACIILH
ncbi:MAG: hypothetical protein IJB35_03415 [Oscillospiraceae bacterium]|nr:hypothetical protein [Oscillospiraceae bacterium]